MASTARSAIRRLLSEFVGDFRSLTSTSAGAAGGTSVVCTEFANLTEDDGGLQGWIQATSGDNDLEVRRILGGSSGYTASSVTATVNFAFSNQFASSVTFELHTIDPAYKHNAIDRAIESLFPDLYVYIRDESLVVDNLLANQDFENGTFTSWTTTGPGTVAAETTRFIHGTQSAKLSVGETTTSLNQNLFSSVNISEIEGRTLRFAGWIWTDQTSKGRLRVTFDGSTYTNGAFHAGNGEWEGPNLTFVDALVPDDATEMTVRCEVSTGVAVVVYFDAVHAYVGPRVTKYTQPTTIRRLMSVQMQAEMTRPNGNYFDLSENVAPSPGRILRLIGQDALTLPTTDSSTVEIDGNQVELLVARAAEILARAEFARTRDPFWQEIEQKGIDEVARLMPRARMRRLAATKRFRWKQEADGSEKFLVLER
ncbi:hypothetical protein LCGC14_1976320 [marine sediment metagenome]|uniref:Uncharacterized protein n=1 Tax=marine sediment metagenome TaxID=412755 RepID=A0A0F9FAQ1_9ZZZZ